jgi:uncharacterized membrane protein HdeD (DUF308 family)
VNQFKHVNDFPAFLAVSLEAAGAKKGKITVASQTMASQTMTSQSIARPFRQAAGLSIGISLVMIALGVLSIAVPQATGTGVAVFVAYIIIFGGLAHLAYAFAAERAGTFFWRLLIGVAYVVGGLYLAFNPGLSLEALTLVLAVIFFVEGLLRIVFFFQSRSLPGAGWILFDGVMTVILGFLIVRNWPSSSSWAIGTIVGVNLCVSGVTRLMFSASARRALKEVA